MDLYIVEIEESVQFGGYQTAKLVEAVILTISFRNPINDEKVTGTHVFRIIEEAKQPKYGPPVVIGLPTICSYYLDFFSDLLRHQHMTMRKGLPLQITLEEELQRLKLRAVPKKIPRQIPAMILMQAALDNTEEVEAWKQLSDEEQAALEVDIIDELTAEQDDLWEEVKAQPLGPELSREVYNHQVHSAVSMGAKRKRKMMAIKKSFYSRHNKPTRAYSSTSHEDAKGPMYITMQELDSRYEREKIEKQKARLEAHQKAARDAENLTEPIALRTTKAVESDGHLSMLTFQRENNCDWNEYLWDEPFLNRFRKSSNNEPEEQKPYQGTILDVDMSSQQLLEFWEQDRQNKYWDIYLDKLSETGRQMTGFSKMAREKLDSSDPLDDEYDEYIRKLKSGEAELDTFTVMYMEQQKHGGLTVAQYIQWQEDKYLDHFNKIAYPVFLDFDAQKYMEDTILPWTHTLGESPEERDSYIPDGNSGIYNYLSTTREEALEKYMKDARKNTTPEAWAEMSDVITSDRCKKIFCPEEWTGMKEIEPIKLQFTDEIGRAHV